MKEKPIYDSSSFAREEELERRLIRKEEGSFCDCCKKSIESSHNHQIVLYKTKWDEICSKLPLQRWSNRNILLCPDCMEKLNEGPFNYNDLAKREGLDLPYNLWYIKEKNYISELKKTFCFLDTQTKKINSNAYKFLFFDVFGMTVSEASKSL